jgi:hypothetical protein
MAHKALPIAAGVVVAAVASALLNRWLAHRCATRSRSRAFHGDLGGAGAGRAVSATDPGVSSCVRILLSERSSRCGDPIAASDTGSGRSVESHLSPLLSRLIWLLLLRKIFGPSPVPAKFKGFPEEMAVRPSQIRASAAESALMIPSAFTLKKHYRLLQMPISIVAGAEDRVIESEQAAHLHREIPHILELDTWCIRQRRGKFMGAIDMVAAQNGKFRAATSDA